MPEGMVELSFAARQKHLGLAVEHFTAQKQADNPPTLPFFGINLAKNS
jgi:hypothetical protein